MTAKTSQILADTLREAGFEALADEAERDTYHDYLSPHDLPSVELDKALLAIIHGKTTNQAKAAARAIRARHHNGDFDASTEESDEWAESEDGKAAFGALIGGKE